LLASGRKAGYLCTNLLSVPRESSGPVIESSHRSSFCEDDGRALYITINQLETRYSMGVGWSDRRRCSVALIDCPDCGRQVSDKATACPQCGYPIASLLPAPTVQTPVAAAPSLPKQRMPVWKIVLMVVGAAAAIWLVVSVVSVTMLGQSVRESFDDAAESEVTSPVVANSVAAAVTTTTNAPIPDYYEIRFHEPNPPGAPRPDTPLLSNPYNYLVHTWAVEASKLMDRWGADPLETEVLGSIGARVCTRVATGEMQRSIVEELLTLTPLRTPFSSDRVGMITAIAESMADDLCPTLYPDTPADR
jgi:hypothetical protein